MSITILLIIITSVVSISAFSNKALYLKLMFNAYQVYHRKQWYRLFSSALVHANWMHLLVNMFVLYFFGEAAEHYLEQLSPSYVKFPTLVFLLLYVTSAGFSSTISLLKHKNDHWYNAVGASGAVAAVMFFTIFFNPWHKLYLYAAIPIPGIIFAIAYVLYSHYKGRRQDDNVGHDAHLLGAIYGFLFPLFIDLKLIEVFIHQLFKLG